MDVPSNGTVAQVSSSPPRASNVPSIGLAGLALLIPAIASFAFFYSRGEILLSGDAVAHINIARRIFDSRTPGLFQLGTVWLPLPHLLTLPFIVNDRLWKSGVGGSIVSIISYVVSGCGVYRLCARWSALAAWIGVAVFAANPNLLYVQSTALNEPLYFAAFIWTVVFFTEAAQQLRAEQFVSAGVSLERGAIALSAAVLTRYDGWFLAAVCWIAMLPILWRTCRQRALGTFRRSVAKALLLSALGPSLWLAYNFGVYKNALEFANGPYSARAIAEQSTANGAPPYPGERDLRTAAIYFTKAAQLIVGPGRFAKLLLALAALTSVAALFSEYWLPVVLLWSPIVFYPLSIAYGAVPIFLPVWWPFSYYNVRYGLELLPAIAVGMALLLKWASHATRRSIQPTFAAFLLMITAVCYVREARAVPVYLREARANGQARMDYDHRLAAVLHSLPSQATVLAYTGAHSGAFELADFHLDRTVNEGIHFVWDAALQNPAQVADYVIAEHGDPVSEAVRRHPKNLLPVATIAVPGQSAAVVYRSASR